MDREQIIVVHSTNWDAAYDSTKIFYFNKQSMHEVYEYIMKEVSEEFRLPFYKNETEWKEHNRDGMYPYDPLSEEELFERGAAYITDEYIRHIEVYRTEIFGTRVTRKNTKV